jgi:hypothetical protein
LVLAGIYRSDTKKLIFDKLGVGPNQDFTKTDEDDPAAFAIDGIDRKLTYRGAGHVMGTYRMGTDPKISVVDSFQRSRDHPNLYLVGSDTFPTVGPLIRRSRYQRWRYGPRTALPRTSAREGDGGISSDSYRPHRERLFLVGKSYPAISAMLSLCVPKT